MSMMKLLATFERVGVREIGLKSSLMLQIEDALGRGQTLASFHAIFISILFVINFQYN